MRGRSLATVVILVVLVVATRQASDCCVPFPLAQKQEPLRDQYFQAKILPSCSLFVIFICRVPKKNIIKKQKCDICDIFESIY